MVQEQIHPAAHVINKKGHSGHAHLQINGRLFFPAGRQDQSVWKWKFPQQSSWQIKYEHCYAVIDALNIWKDGGERDHEKVEIVSEEARTSKTSSG